MFLKKIRSFSKRNYKFKYHKHNINQYHQKFFYFWKKKPYILVKNNSINLTNKEHLRIMHFYRYLYKDFTHIYHCLSFQNPLYFIYINKKKYIYLLINPINFILYKKTLTYNFIVLKSVNIKKKFISLILPSKKLIYIPLLYLSSKKFINPKNNLIYKKLFKFKTVRGIAKNPVDHPNGGRSNTKQPLKNKFFKIAKNNKLCLN